MISSNALRKLLEVCNIDERKLTAFDEYVIEEVYREIEREIEERHALENSDCIYTELDLDEAERDAKEEVIYDLSNQVDKMFVSDDYIEEIRRISENYKLGDDTFDEFLEELNGYLSDKLNNDIFL